MKLQREDIHPLQDTCPYFESRGSTATDPRLLNFSHRKILHIIFQNFPL